MFGLPAGDNSDGQHALHNTRDTVESSYKIKNGLMSVNSSHHKITPT